MSDSSAPRPTQLLVVEDDPVISAAVTSRLQSGGFAVTQVGDGPTAVSTAASLRPDLVVLDLMLPGLDGLEVCRRIQADRPVPVIMLTARGEETDLLVGLGVGADDYLTKPFSPRELVARIRVLLRRIERAAELHRNQRPERQQLGALLIMRGERRVMIENVEVHLTPTEFDLLITLAGAPRSVFSREQLLATVWGWPDASGTRTVDSHVKSLRRKIGADWVRTVHGVGYALESDA